MNVDPAMTKSFHWMAAEKNMHAHKHDCIIKDVHIYTYKATHTCRETIMTRILIILLDSCSVTHIDINILYANL